MKNKLVKLGIDSEVIIPELDDKQAEVLKKETKDLDEEEIFTFIPLITRLIEGL